MSFRLSEPSDIPRLLELHSQFYVEEGYPFNSADAERAVRELLSDPSLGHLFVIEDNHSIVGYLAVSFGFSLEFGGRDAFVDEIYVVREARGKGHGTAALGVAEQTCRESGVKALHLEVEHANLEARELYLRCGFTEHTRFLMTKRLERR